VPTLSAEAIAGYGYAAGWRGEALVIATAIALAESSGRTDAVGDVNLTVSGEKSVGLWQINYRPARDALGGPRDPNRNLDPATNARNAYGISSGGTKWSPWSTYTNGAYRKHLDAARAGARLVEERGGTAGTAYSTSTSTIPGSNASAGARSPNRISPSAPYSPTGHAEAIEVGGRTLLELVGHRLLDASLDLTHSAIPELSFTVHLAPGGMINRLTEHFVEGVEVAYGELRFVVSAIEVGPSDAGMQLTVTARSRGMSRLRKKDAGTFANVSPSEVAYQGALYAKSGYVIEGSAARATIAPEKRDNGKTESWYELIERLAGELGFVFFETGRTLYFGRPTWLIGQALPFEAQFQYRLGKDIPTAPTWRRTADDEERSTTIELDVPLRLGSKVRPGHRLEFDGVSVAVAGKYLVTAVSWSPTDPTGLVHIAAEKPVDPTPTADPITGEPKTATAATAATSVTAAAQNGKASALDFVSVALAQVGDSYVYGAEVRLDDADPDRFDCSELVQWACARVGVTIPDGSSAQEAATTRISVEQAARTRGALLFHPGHVAISLGDGKNTVEAMGRKYGVVQGTIASRFRTAGLIKGMQYGGSSATGGSGGAIAVVD